MPTLKFLPVPIRLPLFRVNVSATRTGLACVSRGDKHNWNSGNCSFVLYEYPELIKSPVIRSTPLSFAAWFLVEAIPDSGQILKRQCSIRLLCLSYQLLTDVVVQPLLKATFSPRKPSQQPSRVASAFGLNVCSDSTKFVSNRLDVFTTPGFTCRGGSNIFATKIDSNHFGCFTRWWGVYLNHKVDVIIALLRLIQCCTGEVLPSEQRNLISTDGQLKINPSTLQGHAHSLLGFHIFKSADIQANGSGSELVDLLDCFGITNYSPDSLTNMIGFQSCNFTNGLINFVVKFGRISTIVAFSYCEYLVASISKSPQSLIDLWSKLYRDYKLAFNRQRLSHTYILTHPARQMETSGVLNSISFPPIPPTAKSRWVSRSFL